MATLHIAFKARNGKRIARKWSIPERIATDPVLRASTISAKCAMYNDTMVNWHIDTTDTVIMETASK